MAKFVIECPQCGKYAEGSTGFFAKKKINCSCGHVIDIRTEKLSSKVCPKCGNTVVYDQTKGENAVCPVCHEKINTRESLKSLVEFTCPSCNCKLSADKAAESYTCPLCDTVIDVQERIKKEEIKKQGLASVIKYEGGNDVFVWKHPIEDFNLGSQLIVHESQEALFFRDGKALDLFGAGRYTLATQNLPLLENLYKLPTNADEVFHSEVYFINLTTQMGIKWGTDSKVRFFDPASGLHIEIGACGSFNIRVCDSRKLVLKLVGTTNELTGADVMGVEAFGITFIVGKFRSLIMNKVKANLARAIRENDINILAIDEYIDILSEKLKVIINSTLEDYGLTMPEFFITNIVTPDDDPNFKRLKQQFADKTLLVRQEEIKRAEAEAAQGRKIVEAQTEAKLKMVGAQGEAEALRIKAQAEADAYRAQAFAEADEMKAKGYTYQQETVRKVGMEAMQNGITGNGSGNGLLGDVAGLGVTLGTMGSVIGMTKDALNPVAKDAADIGKTVGEGVAAASGVGTSSADLWDCPACGTKGIKTKFCPECGAKKPEAPVLWDCPVCGTKGIKSKFCPECGTKKPEVPATWTCPVCGATGITSKFCPECGAKKS
jgi:membrane protease subunit (stomatin/prohibitin family)